MARRWSEQAARSVMAEWEQSGKSARAFAEERGVDAERLYRWRRKLAPQAAALRPVTSFVPVRVVEPHDESGVTVELRNGRAIRLRRGFDEMLFARVVAVLEGA